MNIQIELNNNTKNDKVAKIDFQQLLSTALKRGNMFKWKSTTNEFLLHFCIGNFWYFRLTPVGITSVIAGKILGVNDLALVMSQLAWFIVTIVLGVLIYQLIIMQLIYLMIVRRNPFKFYVGLAQGTLTAFAMASTWVVVELQNPAWPSRKKNIEKKNIRNTVAKKKNTTIIRGHTVIMASFYF